MKPFPTIAMPHKDILEGRLTMDVFAADLCEVFKGRAPAEYRDPDIFFRKTYITDGLKNLLDIAEKRLKGKGGEPIIQLQTPFGGGKTHSLIALYHKAREWGANVTVFCGDKFPAGKDEPTLWEEFERQLTGKIEILKGKTTPGGERLRGLLQEYQPLLILLDEIHEYVAIKALGVKIGDSNLASQTIAFLQELTGVVKTMDKTVLFVSLPSSNPYKDEKSEELLQALQSILGRMEKIYTPVRDEEISYVIRRRLFSSIDEKEAKEVIEEFLDYAEREKILPEGMEKASYREKFIRSYPFQPEVIDILYKRWGSFPTFQRTRGALRLLSLVVYSMKDTKNPFIRLADFDLRNDEIKRELIKYIGPEYDSVIAQDITSGEAGAKKVDKGLGDAYSSFSFGTRAAITIFLYSFSGGPERGATIREVKLSSVDISTPSSIVVEAVSKLKENLFYVQYDGKMFFTNQPNLNRILLTKMESISDENLRAEEKNLLTSNLKKEHFEIFLWPNNSRDIPDTKRLKLVLQQNQDEEKCKEFLENYGERPRVYRNSLIFLCSMDSERRNFEEFLKRKLAWQLIEKDKTPSLTSEQRRKVRDRIKKAENESKERLRNLYRVILLPSKDGFKEIDLGIPTYGAETTIDREIYERLRSEGEILEKLAPLSLKEKYLRERDCVEIKNILESFSKTPGEIRIVSDEILGDCIKEGVMQGLFGIGDMEDKKPICRHFKTEFSPELVEGELLIRADLCRYLLSEEVTGVAERHIEWKGVEEEKEKETSSERKDYHRIDLKLNVPSGKLSDIVRIVSYIKSRFNQVNVKVEISSRDGEITISDYEDKIKEAINQSDIGIEEERVE